MLKLMKTIEKETACVSLEGRPDTVSAPELEQTLRDVLPSLTNLTLDFAEYEYSALIQPDGSFALYKDKHGFVLGGMDGMKYKEYELQLKPGDRLFLYTDGVPEATNAENELFGTDRMLAALNAAKEKTPEEVLKTVRGAADAFVKDAEQFDDLTMLCLEYRGLEAKV